MEDEENTQYQEQESRLEKLAEALVDNMEINYWTYSNVGNYSMN